MNKHLAFLNSQIEKHITQPSPGEFLQANGETKILGEFTPKILSTKIVKNYAEKQV